MNKSVLFYLLIALLWLVDICALTLLEQPLINALLCIYIACLVRPRISAPTVTHPSIGVHSGCSYVQTILVAAALIIEFLLYYHAITPTMILFIPLTVAGLCARYFCYPSRTIMLGLLSLFILLQTLILDHVVLGMSLSVPYTFLKIFINISIMILFP